MRHWLALLLVVVSGMSLHAGGSLKDARQRLLKGNYGEAREIYTELAKNGKNVEAVIGISRTLESEGEYDKALETIDAALKSSLNADLLARRAELLFVRGRWQDAEKAATQAIDKAKEQFLARWVLGQVLRDRGELERADEEFRWFIRIFNDKDITDPEQLLLIGLASCERARWHHLSDQFQILLDDVFGEATKKDKDFWWAEFEAGKLFLEKHNEAGAARALDKVLTINPRAAAALAYKGISAMQRLEIKDADQYAEQALQINPRLTVALRLKADVHLFGGELGLALKALEKARDVNPRDEQTLARIAACLHAQKKDADFAALLKDVEKHNPKSAIFYSELAESMESRKFFDDAEKYYRRSMELQPKLPAGQSGLGMLFMRLGKEDEARKILDKAFDADNFNVRVSNTLKVLDHLNKYETMKTEHFHIRFDPKNDKVLANFMAKYLEDIYKELAEKFQYQPKGPILIEVFNKHEMFSGRVVALPDLHTIGACTGSVVAMVSPRDKSKVVGKPFNWNRVVRHELVHVFNLDQTRFQVPHWLTEGLAVTMEGTGTPPRWHSLLAEKMRAEELLNLDNILLGFVRPRSPDEWQLAYLQSQLYVEYLTKQHGDKAIGALLAAFAEGMDTGSALQKACNVKKDAFEKGYRAFLEERVAKTGGPAGGKVLTFKQLKEAHAKDPDDADVAAQLADRFYQIGNKKDARKLADAVLIAKGKHPLAAYVKALLLNDGGDADVALSLLETNVDDKTTEPKTLRLLAKFQVESKKIAEATRTLEQGRKADPHDPNWLVALGKIYVKAGDEAKLVDILKEVIKLDADDLLTRRKLAQTLLKQGEFADAEMFARQALEIDVLDAEAQQVLLDALRGLNKEQEIRELKKLLN